MSLFHGGIPPALDSNGNPISGARWQFTVTGTTTAVAVYADDGLETSLGSYVASDSAGRFVDIYFDDAVAYRARLWPDATMTGTPLKDIDPVSDASAASHSMAPGILTSLTDVLDHVNGASFFGILESGSNAGEKVQDVIDELSDLAGDEGAVLRLKPDTAYEWEVDPADDDYNEGTKIRPRVELDLQGARITRRLHGDNERAFMVMSHSKLRNGRIDAVSEFVSVEGSELGTQPGVHGTVGVGAIYGLGGTVADPSELEDAHNWVIENLTLTADKDVERGDGEMVGALLIGLTGNVHTGRIRNIYTPSSDKTYGVVGADWNFLAPPGVFTTEAADFQMLREDYYDEGLLLTTHPYNIVCEEVHAGDLTRPDTAQDVGTFLFRWSGCRGMHAFNSSAGITTAALVILSAGDPGFEWAGQVPRTLVMDCSTFSNIEGDGPQHGYLARLESDADNLRRAIEEEGYAALTRPLIYAGLTIERLRGFTDRGALAKDGIVCRNALGVEILKSTARGFKNGILLDEGAEACRVHKNAISFSRESNIFCGHNDSPPRYCEIFDNEVHSAGRGGGDHAGILLANHVGTKIYDNTCGIEAVHDPSTKWNIRVDAGTGLQGWGNKHRSTGATGTAESILTGEATDGVDRWEIGEMLDTSVINTQYGGVSVLANWRRNFPDGVRRGEFNADRAALSGDTLPAGGTFAKGDIIKYWESDAGAKMGVRCTTAGTAGTLTGVTGGITSGTDDLVVNDSSDLVVGQYVAIAGVTGAKKITAINGTAVTLNSNADATVAGAAVTYSAPVFKKYAAIDA